MLYYKQEITTDMLPGKGSCYPTALACLMDLPLNQVPYFNLFYLSQEDKDNFNAIFLKKLCGGNYEEAHPDAQDNYKRNQSLLLNHWWNTCEFWLATKGYVIEYIDKPNKEQWLKDNPDTLYMVTGLSPRGVGHVVIYRNGEMIHDPHPDNGGVTLDDSAWEILVKFEAGEFLKQ